MNFEGKSDSSVVGHGSIGDYMKALRSVEHDMVSAYNSDGALIVDHSVNQMEAILTRKNK